MTTRQLAKQKVILNWREIQTYIHKWTQSRSTVESLGVHLGHILAKIMLRLSNSRPISLSVLLVHCMISIDRYHVSCTWSKAFYAICWNLERPCVHGK